ncbi:MAG: hypothetical protein HY243_02335 [Proteobacteria bacterium]|nr:hypothetical protein [Pseudomonadota bacterium]
MRIVVTLLAVAGNFAATVALMLSLSTVANVGLTTSANATACDPRHYFCFPCGPKVTSQPQCNRSCCGIMPEGTKPE